MCFISNHLLMCFGSFYIPKHVTGKRELPQITNRKPTETSKATSTITGNMTPNVTHQHTDDDTRCSWSEGDEFGNSRGWWLLKMW